MPSPSRAGLIGADERGTFAEFAARTGWSIIEVKRTFASTGSIDSRKSRAPFDVASHFSYVTTIEGEFRRAIEHMAAIMSVGEVQTSLSTLGYTPGPVDGKFGDRTRAAMRQFLLDNGIPASDEISPEASDALNRALKRRKRAH